MFSFSVLGESIKTYILFLLYIVVFSIDLRFKSQIVPNASERPPFRQEQWAINQPQKSLSNLCIETFVL